MSAPITTHTDWDADRPAIDPAPVGETRDQIKAEALREHRCRPCGCGLCCANTPTEQRGGMHQRMCQPHRAARGGSANPAVSRAQWNEWQDEDCEHEWLDRPESDTRQCLDCGAER